jgi:monoamine oxidase
MAPDNSPRQERIVLCGEGFAEDWAWVEGALKTGVKAGDKVIEWLAD